MFVVRDIVLAALCLLAVGSLVKHRDKYTRTVRVALIPALAAVAIALLVDLVWPIRAVVLIAAAALCLVMEIVIMISPSAGWPRSYVGSLRLGFAMTFASLCLFAAVSTHIVSWSLTFHLVASVTGVAGVTLWVVAFAVLRPKGRPWNGIL